jgi:sporulation protein YlmC with PRC-barrel domain
LDATENKKDRKEDIMRKSLMTLLVVFSALALVSTVAVAADADKHGKMGKEKHQKMGMDKSMLKEKSGATFERSQRLSKVIGSDVSNHQGENLGRVSDLIADEDGRISYLVLARGGVLGIGSALVAIPTTSVAPRVTDDGKVIIDLDARVLEEAPTFSAGSYPDFSDRQWQEEARGYFESGETAPAVEETEPSPMQPRSY